MDDKSELLNQLRIDRGSERGGPGKILLWIIALGVLLAVAAAVWYYGLRPSGVPVHVAVAEAVTEGGA